MISQINHMQHGCPMNGRWDVLRAAYADNAVDFVIYAGFLESVLLDLP
jgi:hypothetical protein